MPRWAQALGLVIAESPWHLSVGVCREDSLVVLKVPQLPCHVQRALHGREAEPRDGKGEGEGEGEGERGRERERARERETAREGERARERETEREGERSTSQKATFELLVQSRLTLSPP